MYSCDKQCGVILCIISVGLAGKNYSSCGVYIIYTAATTIAAIWKNWSFTSSIVHSVCTNCPMCIRVTCTYISLQSTVLAHRRNRWFWKCDLSNVFHNLTLQTIIIHAYMKSMIKINYCHVKCTVAPYTHPCYLAAAVAAAAEIHIML